MQDLVAPTNEELKGYADKWWLVLILGIVWIIFAWIVLSFDFNTVLAIAVFAGVSFIFAGISEFFYAAMVDEWKWLWIALGVISVIAGIVALVWPGQTFLVLAAIVGWYLMFRGLFDLITSIMTKDENDMWWFGLVAGILQIVIGFWAIGYEMWGRFWLLPNAAARFNEPARAAQLIEDQQRKAGADGAMPAARIAARIALLSAVRQRDAAALQTLLADW